MAVLEAQPLQGRFGCSALSLPVAVHEYPYEDTDPACSPFSVACNATQRSFSLSPQSRPLLTLRSLPFLCNTSTTNYHNGQITPPSPRLCPSQIEKAPFPPPVVSTWSPEASPRPIDQQQSRSDEDPSHWYGSTLQSPEEILQCTRQADTPKPLLSPIRFELNVDTRLNDHVEDFDNGKSQPHLDDASSFHSADWDLTAPRRRLSYGEPLDIAELRSVHKSKAPRDIRPRAGWLAKDKDCDSWIDDTLKAQASRPYHSEPSRRKQRLWLNLVEDDEEIKEAHVTAVTTSPTKPRMISIRPRRPTTQSLPVDTMSSAAPDIYFQDDRSTYLPEQPSESLFSSRCGPRIGVPERPPAPLNGLSMEAPDLDKQERQHKAFNRIRSRATWSLTPPLADSPTPRSSETIRRVVPASPALPRPATPPPKAADAGSKLSELTTWILNELEAALMGNSIQLESPVIQQLRLPARQRKIPRRELLVLPRRDFCIASGPLTSHTSPSQFTPAPAINPNSRSQYTDPNSTIASLNRIFPTATTSIISTLLATIIAQNFVSTIAATMQNTPSPFASRLPLPPRRGSSPYHINGLPEHIPSKARAMLGLPPPSPSKVQGSRPPLPSFWRQVEKMEWRNKIAGLEAGLDEEVGLLLSLLVGEDGRFLEALGGAVREIVRMGEENLGERL